LMYVESLGQDRLNKQNQQDSLGGLTMLIKMRESKGFTLVELMIVVAIIGILAAVAVPYYQRYVAKSRLTSLVFPAVHAIENAISTKYAVSGDMPASVANVLTDTTSNLAGDADTAFISTLVWTRADSNNGSLKIIIGTNAKFTSLGDTDAKKTFYGTANGANGKMYWAYSGTLARELGF
jgi:type IV pilus assembly protein PilA